MKNILFTIGCICSVALLSCKKDVAIGDPVPIDPDYVLPQGNASQAANDRIQELYDNYGSYFLYVFTQKDYSWMQSTSTGNPATDTAVLGKPEYVEDMLNFLDDIWLKFLPDDFKKGSGIPYRVFLADTIKQRRSGTGWPPGMEYLYYDYKIYSKSITFAGMNASLRTMTPADKLAKKNNLISVIFNYYLSNGFITLPDEFYTVSDYMTTPATPLTAAYPANVEAWRSRGFLPGSYNAVSGAPSEWYSAYYWTSNKANVRSSDASSYLLHLLQRTDAQMQTYLDTYPLIKQKYDILVNHFITKYGMDIRAIGNATYN